MSCSVSSAKYSVKAKKYSRRSCFSRRNAYSTLLLSAGSCKNGAMRLKLVFWAFSTKQQPRYHKDPCSLWLSLEFVDKNGTVTRLGEVTFEILHSLIVRNHISALSQLLQLILDDFIGEVVEVSNLGAKYAISYQIAQKNRINTPFQDIELFPGCGRVHPTVGLEYPSGI